MDLPPQMEFSPDGNVLVVTERFSGEQGKIAAFTVSPEGCSVKRWSRRRA